MEKTSSGLVIPETREFSYLSGGKPVTYQMSVGKATEDGKPRVKITRWQAQRLLKERGYRLPRLQETWEAALQNKEIQDSLLTWPAEWQTELILTPGAPVETKTYLLKDADRGEADLSVSHIARVLVPVSEEYEEGRQIVRANVFDIPDYKPDEFRYNPENPKTWDPETGFFNFNGFDPEGRYFAFFPSGEYLHAVNLNWSGFADCTWRPEDSDDLLGFRGVKISQSANVKSGKSPTGSSGVNDEPRPGNHVTLDKLRRVRAHYLSARAEIDAGLEELGTLERSLQEE